MIEINITTDEISTGLARLAAGLSNMSPVMAEISDYMYDATKNRFNTGIGPDGASWAARSPVTLAAYARRGEKYGAVPLTKMGTMKRQIHKGYGADFAEVGSGAVQAAVMQFGAAQGEFGARIGRTQKTDKVKSHDFFTLLPWGNIPARPFLGISAEDETNISEIILEWMSTITEG